MIFESAIKQYKIEESNFELPTELDIMREYYENEISFLNMAIEYKDTLGSVNESYLEAIHEGYIDNIKKKVKEIVDKFIAFCKKIRDIIKEKIANETMELNKYDRKYEKIYNREIKPIVNKSKDFYEGIKEIIPILRNNGFIKDNPENVTKPNQPGLYLASFSLGKSSNILYSMENISKQLIDYTDLSISEMLNKGFSWEDDNYKETTGIVSDIKDLEDDIKNLDYKYYSENINSFNTLATITKFTRASLQSIKENEIRYTKDIEDLAKAIRHLETTITREIKSGSVTQEDASRLLSILNRLTSLHTSIANTYTKYMANITTKIRRSWYFYVVK